MIKFLGRKKWFNFVLIMNFFQHVIQGRFAMICFSLKYSIKNYKKPFLGLIKSRWKERISITRVLMLKVLLWSSRRRNIKLKSLKTFHGVWIFYFLLYHQTLMTNVLKRSEFFVGNPIPRRNPNRLILSSGVGIQLTSYSFRPKSVQENFEFNSCEKI